MKKKTLGTFVKYISPIFLYYFYPSDNFTASSLCAASTPPPEAHSEYLAACLSLSLSSRVTLLPWPSRVIAQSLQPLLTLHRPLHKWSHSSHLMSSDKCSAPSDAVQHAHPPVHTSPYDRIANQSHFFNGQCVAQNWAESPSFLIECLDVARSRSLSGTRTAALCFLSHNAEKEKKYFLQTRGVPWEKEAVYLKAVTEWDVPSKCVLSLLTARLISQAGKYA